MNKREKGKVFENIAENYLKAKGFEILGRNYRTRQGEIDIIAKKENLIIFVEVRGKTSDSFGLSEESINTSKTMKILETAKHFIYQNNLFDYDYRFDLIAININQVNHIENIITLE